MDPIKHNSARPAERQDQNSQRSLERFWNMGEPFDSVEIHVKPPPRPLELLERLGPSPFERGSFPLIGFLATTYDKVSRYALSRSDAPQHPFFNGDSSLCSQ